MGVQLIDRSTRPLQLTSLGQTYYEGCHALWEQYMELEASIRTAQAQIARTIRVAAIYSVGLGDMGQYVQRFQAGTIPMCACIWSICIPTAFTSTCAKARPISVWCRSRARLAKLTAMPWREEEMVLACSPVHPLAPTWPSAPTSCSGVKYVHFDKDLMIRREVDRFLRDHGVNVDVVMEFDNIENIKKAVELGAGVALLPEPTLAPRGRGTLARARPLVGCRLVRPLGIIHRPASQA